MMLCHLTLDTAGQNSCTGTRYKDVNRPATRGKDPPDQRGALVCMHESQTGTGLKLDMAEKTKIMAQPAVD